MKTYIKIILSAILAGLIYSCEDFVDVENYDGIPADDYITSVANAQSAVNGVYNALYGQNLFYFGIYYYLDFASNELEFRASDEGVKPLVNFGYYDGSSFITQYWKDLYTIVSRANDVCTKIYDLRNSGTLTDSENQDLDKMIGECNFMRAFAYFYLTRSFGDKLPSHPQYDPDELGVPIVDSLLVSKDQYKIPRNTLKECWEKIIHDLEQSYNLLPTSWSNDKLGAATKGAAAGYLGQVYMYMKDYGKAKSWFEKAMQAGNQTGGAYELTKNYAWNFDYNHENNSESIFEVQSQMVSGDYTALASYLWRRLGPDGIGYGMVNVSQQFVDKFSGGYLLTQEIYNDIQANPSNYIAQRAPRRALQLVAVAYQPAIGNRASTRQDFFELYTGDWAALAAQINAQMAAENIRDFDILEDDEAWGTVDGKYVNIIIMAIASDNDPRMYDSFYVPGRDSIASDWAESEPAKPYLVKYYGFKKYIPYNAVESWAGQDPSLPGIDGHNNINQRIFRLADLYLQYAEACYQTGNTSTAAEYLNKVKRRAWGYDINTASAIDFSSGDFMEALIAEREKELCLEGVLWFDYLRWNKAEELFTERGFEPAKHHRLPIPLSERQIVGMDLLLQNSNY